MDDLENNVKRIVSEEVNRSQNEFLSKLDSLFTTKFQVYDQQQKERSDAQFNRIHNDLLSTDSYKFQRKSCEDQYKFNQKVSVALKEAEAVIEPKDPSAARAKQKISEGIELLNYRQKLVKMADSSECGWKLVQEYTANPLADDSEDDRKIFRAQNRAERKIKADRVKRRSRADPYVKPASSSGSRDRQPVSRKPGVCYNCYKPGHWQNECPEKKRPKLSKIFDNCCNLAWDLSYKSNFDLEGGSRLLNSAHKEVNETMVNCVNGPVRYDEGNDQTSGHLNLQVNVLTPVGKLKK
ncbi:unnamed protein product [Mytilus coruscus]|uniref:CCHC-type domain-containing protein n=1 Tax=Mytilus coruscus TaxID=42192 RepID=A0A6J8EE85_MYTCO|nr:unnamed protein product [Mytilus coruscus]